jgi:hypothetical protein
VCFNQIADNDGSTPTDPRSAHHQAPLIFTDALSYVLMSFVKMIFDLIVRHVVNVEDFEFDAKFIIWH